MSDISTLVRCPECSGTNIQIVFVQLNRATLAIHADTPGRVQVAPPRRLISNDGAVSLLLACDSGCPNSWVSFYNLYGEIHTQIEGAL